jgi:ABC-2 type transport system permease protein
MLLFPVVFSVIIAVTFGGNQVPQVYLLVENRDEGLFGNVILSALDSNEVAKYFDVEVVDEGEGLKRIRKGEGSALLRIPETFTGDVIEGTPTALELIRNPAQGIMPEVAEQVAGVLAEVLSTGSHVLRGPLDTIAPFTRSKALRITDDTVAGVALAVKGTVEGAEMFLDPVVIQFESVQLGEAPVETSAAGEEEEDQGSSASDVAFSVFLFVFPGVSVWSLFMVGDIAMRDILTENEAGTLRRQLQGPIGGGAVILSKAGFTAVVCLLGLLVLTLTGWIARDRPVDLGGYLLLSFALILAITGAGAAIYGAAGTQTRGATIASVVYITLGFAGGSFINLQAMPQLVQAIAPISPFYWGTEGYKTLLRGGGLTEVLFPVAVLGILGAVLLMVGAFLLQRRVARGSVA